MWQPTLPGLEGYTSIPQGKLGEIYHALPPEERPHYIAALNNSSVPAEKLVAAVKLLGYTVSASLIRTHRRTSQEAT